eukprot:403365172
MHSRKFSPLGLWHLLQNPALISRIFNQKVKEHPIQIHPSKMPKLTLIYLELLRRNTLFTQRPQTQHQFNGVIKLLEDRNQELKRDEKLIDIIESLHQQNEQQQTSMKQDSLVKKRKYNDDNSLETSLTKSLGSSPKSKIVHFDKQQLIETSESKQFSKVKFIKAQDDTDTSKDQEMLRINIPLNFKEELDYKERVETKPFREFGIDLDNTEKQRQLQTMREDSVKSSMKRTRIELYYNKDQYGRKSVRNRSTAQQKQRLKRTKSPVLKEISIEKKESQQDLKVSKEQMFSYLEKENLKFKMKQYPMKYRPLSIKEQRFEGPLIYFKSQKQHSSRNQQDDEATLEAFKVKNLLKVQLQDKMKQVQDLHLNHNHLKEFQNIVQKVLIEKREAFYNQVREIEKKKNPYISQIYMNAIKNNNIDEIYKLLCKDQALLFIADYSQKTGMHWAAQRNYCEMIQLLYKFGADLNAKDCDHRTPIYLAAKNDHIEAVKILLGLNADPFIKCLKKLGPEDVTDDDTLKTLLRKSKMFQITSNWSTKQKRQVHFINQGIEYLNRNTEEIVTLQAQRNYSKKFTLVRGVSSPNIEMMKQIIVNNPSEITTDIMNTPASNSPKGIKSVVKKLLSRRGTKIDFNEDLSEQIKKIN